MEPVDVFKHELCTFPMALSDSPCSLRKANKAALSDAVWSASEDVSQLSTLSNQRMVNVVDGGSLPHRIQWEKDTTYEAFGKKYAKTVIDVYGAGSYVVFDGYESGPSTKDHAHANRSMGNCSNGVNFKPSMKCVMTKEVSFLISLISQQLENVGCNVRKADADADLLIAQTAVGLSEGNQVTVIGEDTDLKILLLYISATRTRTTSISRMVAIKSAKQNMGHCCHQEKAGT
jgi:hypothetical protein